MATGAAAGYVLGAKAGPQRYPEITESARRFRQRPEVKRITERAAAKLDQLSGQAADKLQAARQSTRTEAGSSGGQPLAVVPATPPSNCRNTCGSGPDPARADRPARRGRPVC